MIRCLVIDDEPLARKLLEEFIAKTPGLVLVNSFSNPLHAREIIHNKECDVLFLDIQMPDINGLDFLKSSQHKPFVILTTAFAEYALESYELDVVDYLLKPFDFQRFLKAVNKISDRLKTKQVTAETENHSENEFLFIKDGKKLVKVEVSAILYVQGALEYVTIVTKDKKIMSLQSLKNMEQTLPGYFVRIHNSYIANLKAIEEVHKDEVKIANEVLPLGVTYKKLFQEKIKDYLRE
jgi:two-component system LytT family response regulator